MYFSDSFHIPLNQSTAMASGTAPDPELEKKVKKGKFKNQCLFNRFNIILLLQLGIEFLKC